MDSNSPPLLAQRTCVQCKSSKKKCDKLLPKCSRCLRISSECSYIELGGQDGSDGGRDPTDSRFDEVFKRLERIENHVFPASVKGQEAMAHGGLAQQPDLQSFRQNFENFTLNPSSIRPQFMSFTLCGSLLRTLKEHDTSMEVVAEKFYQTTAKWLPIISRAKFEKEKILFKRLVANTNFMLQALAMHLVVTPFPDHPPAPSLEESAWYRSCKFHFAQYVALTEPTIELIQAGMLIALFEYLQAIGDRALTTLGICARLAYALDLDDAFARTSARKAGEMTLDEEEVVLTWWGLIQLDRYLNMPPLPFPKQLSTPCPAYQIGIGARPTLAPPASGFVTVDSETMNYNVAELEASQKLGRVYQFIRDHRHDTASVIADGANVLLNELEEYVGMLKIRLRQSGSWAGIIVALGAGLQLRTFFVEKQGYLDPVTMHALHAYVVQIQEIVSQCRTFNGFNDNYLEGIQPTWCSLPFQALRAYKMVRAADTQHTLPEINTTISTEALEMMAPRWKLAEKCLRILEQL